LHRDSALKSNPLVDFGDSSAKVRYAVTFVATVTLTTQPVVVRSREDGTTMLFFAIKLKMNLITRNVLSMILFAVIFIDHFLRNLSAEVFLAVATIRTICNKLF
jgi:hypothetical protein